MKQCPICNELLGDNADVCFKCKYNFVLKRIPTEQNGLNQKVQAPQKEEWQRKINQLEKNALYEYKIEIINDENDGTLNKYAIQDVLTKNAEEGWRLHSVTTNEIGKQVGGASIPFFSMSLNATIEQTLFIFERCIKAENN